MKIGFISDLHIDMNQNYPVMDVLVQTADEKGLDVLAIAGDISESAEITLREVKELAGRLDTLCGCRLLYIPGNHDMWNKHCPGRDADEIYQAYCEDPLCLCGKSMTLKTGSGRRVFLIGDIGWYDYSLASKRFSAEELDRMTLNGRTWQDKLFNNWTRDNGGRENFFRQRLLKQAGQCRSRMQEEDKLIVLTHMLPVRDFCVPEEQLPGWGYFNAFLGSAGLGDAILEMHADAAVCGHVHYRSSVRKGGILWICPCLGTFDEWPLFGIGDVSLAGHIQNALYILCIK